MRPIYSPYLNHDPQEVLAEQFHKASDLPDKGKVAAP